MRIDNETIITSSGVIRNRSKPRVGIVSIHSLDSQVCDEVHDGIDLTFENWYQERKAEVNAAFALRTDLSADEREERIESELQYLNDSYESDESTYLFGDAWVKTDDGSYDIDKTKEYAAVYCSGSGNISVEWSQLTKECRNTSPCYVMADGSGPCGDLDSPGNEVIAYTLPGNMFLNVE